MADCTKPLEKGDRVCASVDATIVSPLYTLWIKTTAHSSLIFHGHLVSPMGVISTEIYPGGPDEK